MKRFISAFLALLIIFGSVPSFSAFAATTTITLTEEQLTKNAYKNIENALKTAKNNATKDKVYTIKLPSGTYTLKNTLHIYSNTKLILQEDTVLVRGFDSSNMLKLGVKEESNLGYSGYENITVSGGTWDADFRGSSCIMRFAHCKNVTLKNSALINQKNAHHMELAAAYNFKIYNCRFEEYKKTESGDGEAIQIDPIHNSYHFPDYYEYDDTPCKNITVEKCTFKNLYAGVGTRSGVVGSYFNNIKIINNYFENISDRAICAFNYKNSIIQNNRINGAGIGIIFEYFPASNLTGKLYMPNDKSKDIKLKNNTGCKIKYNKITVINKTGRENSSGIALYGGIISKDYSDKVGLKAGKYYVQGLTVYKNTINVQSSSSYGMIMLYTYKSSIKANKITAPNQSNELGISLQSSKANTFASNTVKGFVNGIDLIDKSTSNMFKANTVKGNSLYGVSLDKSSKAEFYYGNTFKGKAGKIEINSKKYPLYTSEIKLSVNKGSKKNVLKWNSVKGTGYKIYRSTKKKGGYKLVATVKGKKNTSYVDNHKKGKKYYYKVQAYKTANKSHIYGKYSNIK